MYVYNLIFLTINVYCMIINNLRILRNAIFAITFLSIFSDTKKIIFIKSNQLNNYLILNAFQV